MTLSEDTSTRTEQAVAAATRTSPRAAGRLRRWWRRRPIRRALVFLHRWPTLVLGLFLVLETTSGAILLYHGDYFRATHSALYRHTASANPLDADQAIELVDRAHPDFHAQWVARDHGAWLVGNAGYQAVYGIDPGTGQVSAPVGTDGGVMGVLENLHDCAFSCEGFPGYQGWLADTVPTLGLSFLTGITWAALILGVLGVLMIVLALTGLVLWWPGRRRLRHGMRVRTGKGRFARDYDLHNVIGIVALPFVLMWGITGAAFEFPVVEKAWLAVTGGDQPGTELFALTPDPATAHQPQLTSAQAVSAALAQVPGTATFVGRPVPGVGYYEIDIISGYASQAHRAIYNGDTYVLVDAHNAAHTKVIGDGSGPLSNRFYDKFLAPTHFGWNVNGWWRLIWFALGMAPLVLMVTALSTWLFRRGVRRRRRAAA